MKKNLLNSALLLKKAFFFILTILIFHSCKDKVNIDEITPQKETKLYSKKAETYDVKVATEWNDLHLKLLESDSSIVAPFAARSIAYVNLALYESVVKGTDNKSMLGQLTDLRKLPVYNDTLEYNWGLSANVAQYTLMKELFFKSSKENQDEIDALRLKFERQFRENVSQAVIERSILFGASVANSIWDYAKLDGSAGTDSLLYPTGYIFPSGLGQWQSVPPSNNPLLPQWKLLRTFVTSNKFISGSKQIPFSYRKDSDFFNETREIVALSKNLNLEEKNQMIYWIGEKDSNFQVVHPFRVLNEAIKSKQINLADAALIYMKGGVGVSDATVAVWREKFESNLVRPISYIRETVDKDWNSVVKTPSTPSFPSLVGAVSGVISKIIERDLAIITLPDTITKVKTLIEFKKVIIDSEVKSGTNFKMASESGFILGEKVAENTNTLKFK